MTRWCCVPQYTAFVLGLREVRPKAFIGDTAFGGHQERFGFLRVVSRLSEPWNTILRLA